MSHHVKQQLPVTIRDLSVLRLALKNMNQKLSLHTDVKKAHYYGGNTVKCDAVIRLEGSEYEVSLHKNEDGTYTAGGDMFHRELREVFCHDQTSSYGSVKMEKLSAEYRMAEVQHEYEADGWTVDKLWDPRNQTYVQELIPPTPF